MKYLLIILIVVGLNPRLLAADDTRCQCPTLRQHSWITLQQAWHKAKVISEQEWQAFLRWRAQQRAEKEQK